MATTAKRPTKRAAKNTGLPEVHTPSEALAHALSQEYNDLAPSVQRIMTSDLGEAGRMHAITLFRDSLGVAGDPNRNPVVAIESSRSMDVEPVAAD